MRNKLRLFGLMMLAILLGLSGPIYSICCFSSNTYALSESRLDMFAQNNIIFYDPDEVRRDCDSYMSVAPSGDSITWIGDSYSVGAKSVILEKIPDVDFGTDTSPYIQSSKFVSSDNAIGGKSGIGILKDIIAAGSLRPYLVFALGTNGGWNQSQMDDFMNIINEQDVKVILVTSKTLSEPTYYEESNKLLINTAGNNDNVFVADWVGAYDDKFFENDPEKIHPSANGGYDAWVNVIYNTLTKAGPTAGSISGSATGSNLDYAGNQIWSDAEMQAIEANKNIYMSSGEKYGVPWQVLAVIHMRESGLKRYNDSNGQGVYQFAEESEQNACTALNGASFAAGPLSEEEFQKHTDCAAKRLVEAYGFTDNSDNTIKKVFYSYNSGPNAGRPGMAYYDQAIRMGFSAEEAARGEGSPYVMNRADLKRDPTVEPTKSNGTWGQIKYDYGAMKYPANQDYGAFIYYMALGGSSSVINCGSGGKLTPGGMTLDEANAYMKTYLDIATAETNNYDWETNKYGINQTGCAGGSFYNCVAFSQYFVSQNTPNVASGMPNGKDVVQSLVSRGLADYGESTPEVYAIFSTSIHSSDPSVGHTGVVLGITETTVIIGEAGCGNGASGVQAREIPIGIATDGSYEYAYLKNLNI